jgi:ParB-like chromosome segregation protein Spo0J
MPMAARVWEGNDQLRRLLTPLDELHPHPRNPRRGNVREIGRSLARFGQQRPVLALPDGTIVAGHHVVEAARVREWTHVAVIRSDLTEEEVEAYLLADNGTADQGYYDERLLAALLAEWEDYEGTGFSKADAEKLVQQMLAEPDLAPAPRAASPGEQPLAQGTAEAFNIVLTFDEATYRRVADACERVLGGGHGSFADAVRSVVLAP